ncbi:MAG: aldo/keto reductase [Deltaproteobacteria bacterium]|nr:aldo/keto reductase [Deltaproteobacteria bacterium]
MRTITVQGVPVPAFFYGTAWKEERTEDLTRAALEAGFTAIDTANQRRHYVEAAVGEAIRSLDRSKLFLQTKFTHLDGQDHPAPYDPGASPALQVAQSLASSLEHLRTDYVDSFVLHGPSLLDRFSSVDRQVWRAMAEEQSAGRARLLGVANVSRAHLETLFEADGPRPAFVQNRCWASTGWDREVRAFCRAHGIAYQAFSLLTANRRELAAPAVRDLARRTGRTVPQVVFRFALQVGMIPLTGTSDPAHMREDLACLDFALSDDDLAVVERLAPP